MYSAEKHLSPEQVEWLINGKGSDGAAGVPVEFWDEARQHLAQCAACEKLVHLHGEIQKRLEGRMGQLAQPSAANCPDEKVWYELAAGTLPEPDAEKLMDHAIQCDHCSPLLKAATEDLQPGTTPQDLTQISALKSATVDWQRSMAARMSDSRTLQERRAPEHTPRRSWIPLAGWAFAALALVLLGGFWLTGRDTVAKANHLVAKAYSLNRKTDFRIGQAEYGPIRAERGSRKESPEQMFEARAILARLRKSHENDPDFLQAQGRASLAELDIPTALVTLKRAHELQPQSESILTDLATTYAVEGDSGAPESYAIALQYLDEALQKTPNDSAALFNRAILYERLQSFDHAVKDWNAFLLISPVGPWAEEARKKADDDSEKLKKEKERGLTPHTLLKWLQTSPSTEELEARSEDLVDAATSDWIQNAHALSAELTLVARTNRDWNHDQWLSDLLEHSTESGFATAASHLVAAVSANNSGDHGIALTNARQAVTEFDAMGIVAGSIRSRWEGAYALQRSGDAKPCIADSREIKKLARAHEYSWIETQSEMVEGVCIGMLGDDQSAAEIFTRALSLSQGHNYSSLELRAMVMVSSTEGLEGEFRQEWSTDIDGLSRYWTRSSPPLRAYQFYSDLTSLAEKARHWNTAKDFGEEAVRAAHESPYRYAEAIAELHLGEDFKNCSDLKSAVAHFDIASRLFSQLTPSAATNLYRIDAEIGIANIESERPSSSSVSLARLAAIEPVVKMIDQRRIVLRYYNALGNLYVTAGKLSQAQSAYENSIAITRHERSSIISAESRASLAQDAVAAYRSLSKTLLLQSHADHALNVWEDFEGSEWVDKIAGQVSAQSLTRSFSTSTDVQSLLPLLTNETFVTFMRGSDGLNVWVFDARGIQFRHVDVSPNQLDAAVAHFARICSTPDSSLDEVTRSAREIYSWYIAPVDSLLSESKTLVIEPDPLDSDLPFSALQNQRGQFLGLSFNLVQSAGLSEWIHLKRVAPVLATDHALLVADPSLGDHSSEEFAPLPDAVAEAQSISAMFPTARLLSGSDANSPAVNASIFNVAIFHFAGHSVRTPRQNGLVLSDSPGHHTQGLSILDPASFSSGSFRNAKVFVLASCSSGKRSAQDSLAWQSIAHSFQLAGVPNVVATNWDVESRATSQYTVRFYQELLRGKPVAAAVRAAAQATASSPSTSHPYYWASFVVYGRG